VGTEDTLYKAVHVFDHCGDVPFAHGEVFFVKLWREEVSIVGVQLKKEGGGLLFGECVMLNDVANAHGSIIIVCAIGKAILHPPHFLIFVALEVVFGFFSVVGTKLKRFETAYDFGNVHCYCLARWWVG